jgi:hypothetical protein
MFDRNGLKSGPDRAQFERRKKRPAKLADLSI